MAANGKPGSSSYTPLSSSSLSSDSSSLFSSFPSPSSAATVPGGYRYPAFKRFNRINLRFKISYYTQWGQNLMISGSDLLLGRWNVKQGVWMTPHHEGEFLVWQALISVPERFDFEYKYALVDEELNVIKWESGSKRRLVLPDGLADGAVVDVLDTWQDGSSPETLLARSAFRQVIFRKPGAPATRGSSRSTDLQLRTGATGGAFSSDARGAADNEALEPATPLAPPQPELFEAKDSVVLRFRITCSRIERGQRVFITGSPEALGCWQTQSALAMTRTQGTLWEADVCLPRDEFPIRYKYLLVDSDGTVTPEYGTDIELGLDTSARKPSVMIFVADGHFRANPWRGAGLAMPVFSLRTEASLGVGEFSDLRLVVDFAVATGLRLVQLLPVNDTSVNGMWWDSYPYSSLSVFALHPLYLRLEGLTTSMPASIQAEIDSIRKTLNALPAVDYEQSLKAKMRIAGQLFELEGAEVLASEGFQRYFQENKEWLKPYAAFCFLKELFGTADHSQWGLFSEYSEQKVDRIGASHQKFHSSIAFSYYVQYFLHVQLLEVSEHARQQRVVLKGDLPIGVDRNSVDTWMYKSLFNMDTATGAPPDAFSTGGQNWGFPTYNWDEMSKDNYAWWRARLTQMSKYFSAYRIDHILGFFRIWEMPAHAVTGLMGHFRPSYPITAEEMEKEGVWDFNRLSEPYIRCHLLQEVFGRRWTELASKYFEEYQHLCYRFKKEYSTEKKIVEAAKARDGSPEWLEEEAEATKKGLLALYQNVCLIRDTENPRMFYPRFDCEKTSSFNELDDHTKGVIKRLYVDYYYSRQEAMWRSNALKTLPVLMNASDMLACGEDLGLVPACVPPVLAELGLLGLRIQRMPTKLGEEFGNPLDYDYMTVCAPSCHDTSTLRAWWEESAERRNKFFRDCLGFCAPAPDLCTPEVARAVIQQHCDSPSVWAIFPLQDLLALVQEYSSRPANEETINDPTNPRHYWRFRFHVTMEHLLKDKELINRIQEVLLSSGRALPDDLPEAYRTSASLFLANTIGSLSLAPAGSTTAAAAGAATLAGTPGTSL